MLKLYVNRMPLNRPWGGGNMFVQALYKHSEEFGVKIIPANDKQTEPDAALVIGLDPDSASNASGINSLIKYKLMREQFGASKFPIVIRCNENDARKNTNLVDNKWKHACNYVDGVIYVSDYIKSYHNFNCPKNTVIINGVDKEIFQPQEKFNNGKINIVAHHWSDNPLKGFDIYESIDRFVGEHQQYTFTYIGRERGTFKNTKVIKPLFGKHLGEELGRYDVYVSASRAEPGPNHILEALACKLPTFVKTDGGACLEFINNNDKFIYEDFEDLKSKLQNWKENNLKSYQNINLQNWKTVIEKYCTFIKEVEKSVK